MILKFNNFISKINETNTLDIMKNNYNKYIDYTLLDENSTEDDIISLTEKARIIEPKSVCVLPKWVKLSKEELEDTDILVCTVISFPGGTNTIDEKITETKRAIQDGADEIDMVLNYQLLKEKWNDGDIDNDMYNYLIEEISSLSDICHDNNVILKVIVESGELTIPQTNFATQLCLESNADFIKTSTGKVDVGAELDKVKEMKKVIDESDKNMLIKASGGIRTLEDIKTFEPYIDRYGMGSGAVEKLNGIIELEDNSY